MAPILFRMELLKKYLILMDHGPLEKFPMIHLMFWRVAIMD